MGLPLQLESHQAAEHIPVLTSSPQFLEMPSVPARAPLSRIQVVRLMRQTLPRSEQSRSVLLMLLKWSSVALAVLYMVSMTLACFRPENNPSTKQNKAVTEEGIYYYSYTDIFFKRMAYKK